MYPDLNKIEERVLSDFDKGVEERRLLNLPSSMSAR